MDSFYAEQAEEEVSFTNPLSGAGTTNIRFHTQRCINKK